MAQRYRSLNTNRLAEYFVEEILGFSNSSNIQEAIELIVDAERGIEDATKYPTITHDDCRDIPYVTNGQRAALRDRIFRELISQKRLDSDDDIRLEVGGALPKTKIKK
jgi:hypothetical protein